MTNRSSFVLSKSVAQFSFLLIAWAIFAIGISLSPAVAAAQFTVGVLPFADNTGSGQDVSGPVSRAVQTEIVHSTKLNGRILTLPDGADVNNLDAQQALTIGRAAGVDVVVVGTVLEATASESSSSASLPSFGGISLGGSKNSVKAEVTLQADVYSTTTGNKIDSIRESGNASQTKVGANVSTDLGGLDSGGADFDNSAIGKAFHQAVSNVVKKINSDQGQMAHYSASAAPTQAAAAAPPPAQSGGAGSAPAAAAPAAAPASGSEPQFKSITIDFVPGERTIFYDDFSDMAQDQPPPHWRLRDGKVDLLIAGDTRELHADNTVTLTSPTFQLPPNFTFELVWTGTGETNWSFHNQAGDEVLHAMVRGEEDGNTVNMSVTAACQGCGDLGSGTYQTDTSKPVEFDLWVQQGRLRAYVDGQRLVDVNQVDASGITQVQAEIAGYRPNGIRKVRLAESAPDFSSIISSTGKFVTHGITFDTDSDVLKPESAPVIKEVAAALTTNPALKLEVDGYTDSVGDAAHNVDLSNRRAQSVVNVLVSQFGVAPARLSAKGMGDANPIASNDTADGRAANRRVEFLKK
ncbi:MAG TPA: OmpA family protein [Terracidiphilus sp.]|nr:OmpA family protein [Terracidiphilus sp.]